MIKKHLFTVLFLLLSYSVISQVTDKHKVKLVYDKEMKRGGVWGLDFDTSKKRYCNDVLYIGSTDKHLQPIVDWWVLYKSKFDKSKYKNFIQSLKFTEAPFNLKDTINLPSIRLKNCVYFHLGIAKDSSILIATSLDSNDIDFTKNVATIGNLKDRLIAQNYYSFPFKKVPFWNGKKIIKKDIVIEFEISKTEFNSGINPTFLKKISGRDFFWFSCRKVKTAKLILEGDTITVLAQVGSFDNLYDCYNKSFMIFSNDEKVDNAGWDFKLMKGENYKISDTFYLRGKYYYIESLDPTCTWLEIVEIKENNVIGSR